MRRRFLKGGLESFADHEALELLLYYAIPRRDTNPVAHALMERYGSLSAVLAAPVEDLKQVAGIGESAAILLKLPLQICGKAKMADVEQETVLSSVERVGAYLLDRFAGESNEVIYQLCLDRKGKLLACKRIGEGGVSDAEMNLRRMVENAVLTKASGVILAHNHPGGLPLPSEEDVATTKSIRDALMPMGILLMDHIIVSDGDFVSMNQSGFFR